MNNSITCVQHCKLTMFADDCVLYYTGNSRNNIHNVLQFDLNNVISWCKSIGLAPYRLKTKTIIIGTSNKLKQTITQVSYHCHLPMPIKVIAYHALDVLCFTKNVKLVDRISRIDLHKGAK